MGRKSCASAIQPDGDQLRHPYAEMSRLALIAPMASGVKTMYMLDRRFHRPESDAVAAVEAQLALSSRNRHALDHEGIRP